MSAGNTSSPTAIANYWRPNAPYLDRIVWRVITDRAAAAAQMEAGELHY